MMKHKSADYNKFSGGTWLTTYADLMNNLLVLFILLYMFSILDLQKFKQFTSTMSATLGGKESVTEAVTIESEEIPDIIETTVAFTEETEQVAETTATETTAAETTAETIELMGTGVMDDLDEFVNKIAEVVRKKGYGDQLVVERVDNYVYLRLNEGILFFPNRADLKQDSYEVLKMVADIINEAYDEIYKVEICGHTAWVQIDTDSTNFNSWELSSERALTVLKYFVTKCDMPKDKLIMSAYSSTEPYTEGRTEEEKAMNRRVEIRLSRMIDVKNNGLN